MKRLLKEKRGAVLAEFIIAFVPMMGMFFCFTQYSRAAVAKLVMRHGAMAGARAAVVVYGACESNAGNCNGFNPGANLENSETPEKVVRDAAVITMAGWVSGFDVLNVDINRQGTTASTSDPKGMVQVRVRGAFRCDVPMARYIMCPGGYIPMTSEAQLPVQGALYKSTAKDNQW
jgi:hypothetical protein